MKNLSVSLHFYGDSHGGNQILNADGGPLLSSTNECFCFMSANQEHNLSIWGSF